MSSVGEAAVFGMPPRQKKIPTPRTNIRRLWSGDLPSPPVLSLENVGSPATLTSQAAFGRSSDSRFALLPGAFPGGFAAETANSPVTFPFLSTKTAGVRPRSQRRDRAGLTPASLLAPRNGENRTALLYDIPYYYNRCRKTVKGKPVCFQFRYFV